MEIQNNLNLRKRGREENFGSELTFESLTEQNFGEFLKVKKIIFKPERIQEIWNKLSHEFGEEIAKVLNILNILEIYFLKISYFILFYKRNIL